MVDVKISASESGDVEVASPLDTTALTDDFTSLASPEAEGLTNEGERTEQMAGTKEHYFFFIPKVEPLPWPTFLFQTLNCICPTVIYSAIFTPMGIGLSTFYYFAENFSDLKYYLSFAISGAFLIFYLFDIDTWKSNVGVFFRYVYFFITVLGLIALCLFVTEDSPAAPIAIFSFLIPSWLFFIKRVFFESRDFRLYISQLSGPLFVASICHFVAFIAWVFSSPDHRYNETTKKIYAEATGCVVTPEHDCNTLIIYIGPILVGLTLFFFSFFASFLHSDTPTKDITSFLKLWMILMCVFWVTISLNYASNGLTETLIILTLAAFAGATFLLAASYTKEEIEEQEKELWETFAEKYASYLDIMRGLGVVMLLPIGLLYLCLSFVNQSIRKLSCPCSKPLDDSQRGFLTKKTRQQLDVVKTWDIAKVITYGIYWGIAYMLYQVIATQFLSLFLGWLSQAVKGLSLAVLTLIMVLVGLSMFLLPPIPGVPIYLFLGIVIPPVGQEILGGLTAAYFYCVAVSLVLKLGASAMQQKLIGQGLSSFTSIRKLAMVNSSVVRTIRIILSDRGFSIAKIAILVGGPDWPTSVLAGIMKLDLLPIMIGTLPIIFLIMPTVFTGTLLYMRGLVDDLGNPLYEWATTAYVIALGTTTAVQLGSSVVALIYVEKVMSARKEEVDRLPIDQEVKTLEEADESYDKEFLETTKWSRIPKWAKFTLVLSLLSMVTACYVVTLFLSSSFAEFEMSDTIQEKLDGNWLNFILPLGWLSLILFFVSIFLLFVFMQWAKYTTKNGLAAGAAGSNISS